MHDGIIGLLPLIDQTLADCVGVVDQLSLDRVAHMRNRLATRLAYPDDVLLAALAGGTGSGKSSLFNAIAGEEIAPTGGVRPTTAQPKALVPRSRASALAGYLDRIGIDDRTSHEGHDWLCLIDLPDTDSVEIDHRLRVDSLLPGADCVVWVVDPEKYRDAALHHGYLTPMADYQSQFVFVLNQTDRLAGKEVEQVKADLRAALLEDGIENPTVLATAAHPAAGPPLGIEALLDHLRAKLGGSVYEKLLVDLRIGSASLIDAPGSGSGVEFEDRWHVLVEEAADRIVAGDRSGGGQQVAAFLDQIADEIGGDPARTIREMAARAPGTVLAIGPAPAPPSATSRRGWWRRPAKTPSIPVIEPGSAEVRAALDSSIGGPVREVLSKRAKAQASIGELTLALNELTRRTGR